MTAISDLIVSDCCTGRPDSLEELKEYSHNAQSLSLTEKLLLVLYLKRFSAREYNSFKLTELIYINLQSAIINPTSSSTEDLRKLISYFLPACSSPPQRLLFNLEEKRKAFIQNYGVPDLKSLLLENKSGLFCENQKLKNYYKTKYYTASEKLLCGEPSCRGLIVLSKSENRLFCSKCNSDYHDHPSFICKTCKHIVQYYKRIYSYPGVQALPVNPDNRLFNFMCPNKHSNLYLIIGKYNIFKDKAFVVCPNENCKSKNIVISESTLHCNVCNFDYLFTHGDVYWCFGRVCSSPLISLPSKPTSYTLKVQNILNDEGISQLAGWLNRMMIILPFAFCTDCKDPLLPFVKRSANKPKFFSATNFYCGNNNCRSYRKKIYLNTCSNRNCTNPIDSRVIKTKCSNGFLICDVCFSCCHDYLFQRISSRKKGHREQNIVLCPHCAHEMCISNETEHNFYCPICNSNHPIVYHLHKIYHWEALHHSFGFNDDQISITLPSLR